MANYIATTEELTSVADAIRAKNGTTEPLTFPEGFVSAIGDITGGGSGGVLFTEQDFVSVVGYISTTYDICNGDYTWCYCRIPAGKYHISVIQNSGQSASIRCCQTDKTDVGTKLSTLIGTITCASGAGTTTIIDITYPLLCININKSTTDMDWYKAFSAISLRKIE